MKKWRRLIFVFPIFSTSLFVFGQKKAAYLKMTNYMPLFGSVEYLGAEESSRFRVASLSSLGLAFHRELENDRYKEWEIARLLFTQEDTGVSFIETSAFSLGYGYGVILPRKYNTIKVRLGGSLRYYYGHRNIIIINNVIQDTHGLILSFTPHIDWRLHKKFYFEMSPIVQLVNANFRLEDNFQPTQTLEETTAVDYFFNALKLSLRIGVSYRLK